MMKKIAFALVMGVASFSNAGFAEMAEDTAYCDKKCVPSHCERYTARVATCKTDCPSYFAACYAAVPADRKMVVDAAIAAIEAAGAQ